MTEKMETRIEDWRKASSDIVQAFSALDIESPAAGTPLARLCHKVKTLLELGRLIRESEAALKNGQASQALGLLARAQAIVPDRSVQLVEWETDALLAARDELVEQLDDALQSQARAILADRAHVVERLEAEYLPPASQEAERSDRETELRIIRLVINALVRAAEAEQQMAAGDRGRAMEPWQAIITAAGDDLRWTSLVKLARTHLQALQSPPRWQMAVAVAVGVVIGLVIGLLLGWSFIQFLIK